MNVNTARSPAQKASFVSPQLVKERKRDEWLALFADDAVVEDPVGPSLFDPTGKGHRGKKRHRATRGINVDSQNASRQG